MRRRLLATLAGSVVALLTLAGPAGAAMTTTVTSLGDFSASCAVIPEDCTLRSALQISGAGDVIDFAVAGTVNLQSPLPDLPDGVTITGPGADRLDVHRQNGAYRIFTVPSGRTVSISGLTVSNGLVADNGGGLRQAYGGGIYNAGTLTLDRVLIRGNVAIAGSDYISLASGGGIYNSGTLTLRDSTVSGNGINATANGTNASSEADGGGVYGSFGGPTNPTLRIINSTVVGNGGEATSSGSGATHRAYGGGIDTYGTSAQVTGSTVTGNSAATGANVGSQGVAVRNTIISNPRGGGANCFGALFGSEGYNLEDGAAPGSCGLNGPTDLHGDPMLGPLAGSNGNIPPYSLLPGSPAIDAGKSFGLTSDQLGLPRPSDFASTPNAAGGDGADIGAFEVQAPPPPPPPPPTDTTPPETTITTVKVKAKKRLAIISFASSEPGSAFRCKLDKKPLKPCTSPRKLKHLKGGKHRFVVLATDAAGNVDPTPARKKFKLR